MKKMLLLVSVLLTIEALAQSNITSAEYFLGNSDPGEGRAIALQAADGDFDEAVEALFKDSALLSGFGNSFLLNIRVKDAINHWGPLFKRPINIVHTNTESNLGTVRKINITAAEYFFGNTDPGEGNAHTLLVFDGAYDQALETVFQDQVSVNGYGNSFLLNIRVRDADNHWGPLFKRPINIVHTNTDSNLGTVRKINITAAEYFFGNTDPGEGNAHTLLVFDGAYDQALETVLQDQVSINNYGNSFLLNIRVRDADNNWGPLFKRPINIVNTNTDSNLGTVRKINITAAEYFFGNTDPGEGNAHTLLVFDGAYDQALETVLQDQVSISGYGNSFLLNIRVRDEDNHWGPLFKRPINIVNTNTDSNLGTVRKINITAAEYFFGNTDPGEGNAHTLLVFDGAYDQALETIFNDDVLLGNPFGGYFLLNMRAKDADNHWGAVYKKIIHTPVQAGQLIVEGDTINACYNTTVTLHYAGPAGFVPQWSTNATSDSISFTAIHSGYYSVRAQLGNESYMDSIYLVVNALPSTQEIRVPLNTIPYTWNGNTYSLSGTYTVNLPKTMGCDSTAILSLTVLPENVKVNAKLFLEGYYAGNAQMVSTIYDLGLSTNNQETDSVQIALWSPAHLQHSEPDYIQHAILNKDGNSYTIFPAEVFHNWYYIIVRHRNSIQVWSSSPVYMTENVRFDFSSAMNAVYADGIIAPLKIIDNNIFALYGGDANQDGTADAIDLQITENDAYNFSFGYNSSDCNGDGASDALDMQMIENNAALFLFMARPY